MPPGFCAEAFSGAVSRPSGVSPYLSSGARGGGSGGGALQAPGAGVGSTTLCGLRAGSSRGGWLGRRPGRGGGEIIACYTWTSRRGKKHNGFIFRLC